MNKIKNLSLIFLSLAVLIIGFNLKIILAERSNLKKELVLLKHTNKELQSALIENINALEKREKRLVELDIEKKETQKELEHFYAENEKWANTIYPSNLLECLRR